MARVITMIPARLAATRLPNKPLIDINGKTLIQRVYENVKANIKGDICIAAGNQEIYDEAIKFGAKAVLTDPNLPSGTDRIAVALKELDPKGDKYDIVVNFQGDAINVNPNINNKLIEIIEKTNCDMATVGRVFKNVEDANESSNVKIVMGLKNGEKQARALYFTRALAPYIRNPESAVNMDYYHHVGIYVFKAKTLREFVNMDVGVLEAREGLEQLRFLENGYSVQALIVDKLTLQDDAPADIDTQDDLLQARKFIK